MHLLVLLFSLLSESSPSSVEMMEQALQNQQYADVVKMASRMMPTLIKTGDPAERIKVLELKGEAHLQLKQWPQASDAFSQAGNVSADSPTAATDHSLSLLIKKSGGGRYVPKQPTTSPIPVGKAGFDLTDAAQRKIAISAFYNDQAKQMSTVVANLQNATALPALVSGLKQVADLRPLEIAATGHDSNFKSLTGGIASRAAGLMDAGLSQIERDAADIDSQAKTRVLHWVRNYDHMEAVYRDRGLYSTDIQQLNDMIASCDQIAQAADEFARAAAVNSAFASVQTHVATAKNKATAVLNTQYHVNP